MYRVANTLIKISVLLIYRRIFAKSQFRLYITIFEVLVVIWLLAANFVAATQCTPIRKAWLVAMFGHCLDPLNNILRLHSTALALEIIIFALVACTFLLGALSIIIAIIRLIHMATVKIADVTWYTSIDSWTAIEPVIEVLYISLPVMAPFLHLKKTFAELRTSIRSLLSRPRSSKRSIADGQFFKMDKPNDSHDLEQSRCEIYTTATPNNVSDRDDVP